MNTGVLAKMIHERYKDKERLLLNADQLTLTEDTLVQIYQGDKFFDEVFIDLEEDVEKFELLKPYMIWIAENLCQMDIIVQKYNILRGLPKFAMEFSIGNIYLELPDKIRIRYYGTYENTEFVVLLQYINDKFILQQYGNRTDILQDWDK